LKKSDVIEEPLDQKVEAEKRKDFFVKEKMKQKMKEFDDEKKFSSMKSALIKIKKGVMSVLGNAIKLTAKESLDKKKREEEKKKIEALTAKKSIKSENNIGEYTKKYEGAHVTFNQPIDPNKKPRKIFVHLTEKGRDKHEERKAKKSLVFQYTQNQPLDPKYKPLIAYVNLSDEDESENKQDKRKKKAKKSIDWVASDFKPTKEYRRAAEINPESEEGIKYDNKIKEAKKRKEESLDIANKEWLESKENVFRNQPKVPKVSNLKKDRANPIEGGIGDNLKIKDVDENELNIGKKIEQEHIKENSFLDENEKNKVSQDIAMDHLKEDPKYYTHLVEMERRAKEENKQEAKKRKLLKIKVKKGEKHD